MRLSLDLVAAAGQNIGFLRNVAESHWLHHTHVLVEAIRRYDELWMPMMADLTAESGKSPMILPPIDIEWVWFCHTLNSASYRQYCDSRFSKLIGKPAIFNQENKEYAMDRCKEIWIAKYPSESFENESDSGDIHNGKILELEYLLGEVSKQRCLFTKFSKPYMLELVYLIAAKNRYKGFIFMLQRFANSCAAFVSTLDILLLWITHKVSKTHPDIQLTDNSRSGSKASKSKVVDSKLSRQESIEEGSEAAQRYSGKVLTSLEPLDYVFVAFLPGISEELLFRGALLPPFWNQLDKYHGCCCLIRNFACG